MKTILRSLFVITCSIYASLTLAQSYVGLKLGHAEIMSDLESSSSLGWYLGHAVSENFAVELNYDSFGDADIEGVDVELSADALSVYGVFKVDIKTGVTPYAKMGLARLRVKQEANCCGIDDESNYETQFAYGVGLMGGSKKLNVRLEYSAINADEEKLANFSLGIQIGI